MDLRLSPTTLPSTAWPTTAVRPGAAGAGTAAGKASGASFAGELHSALQSVSQAQNNAATLQRQVQMDDPKVSLEETMVAIQKAQIGFQATMTVRNRMVQAYTDIMNMQV